MTVLIIMLVMFAVATAVTVFTVTLFSVYRSWPTAAMTLGLLTGWLAFFFWQPDPSSGVTHPPPPSQAPGFRLPEVPQAAVTKSTRGYLEDYNVPMLIGAALWLGGFLYLCSAPLRRRPR